MLKISYRGSRWCPSCQKNRLAELTAAYEGTRIMLNERFMKFADCDAGQAVATISEQERLGLAFMEAREALAADYDGPEIRVGTLCTEVLV